MFKILHKINPALLLLLLLLLFDRVPRISTLTVQRCAATQRRVSDRGVPGSFTAATVRTVTGLLAGWNWITAGTDVGGQQIRFQRRALSKPVGDGGDRQWAHGGWSELLQRDRARWPGRAGPATSCTTVWPIARTAKTYVDHNLSILLRNVVHHWLTVKHWMHCQLAARRVYLASTSARSNSCPTLSHCRPSATSMNDATIARLVCLVSWYHSYCVSL